MIASRKPRVRTRVCVDEIQNMGRRMERWRDREGLLLRAVLFPSSRDVR